MGLRLAEGIDLARLEDLGGQVPARAKVNELVGLGLLERRGGGLLPAERYTADIPDVAHGLQTQAVAWQALNAIATVWRQTGRTTLGSRARLAAPSLARTASSAQRRS